MTDETVDTSDIPEQGPEFFKTAKIMRVDWRSRIGDLSKLPTAQQKAGAFTNAAFGELLDAAKESGLPPGGFMQALMSMAAHYAMHGAEIPASAKMREVMVRSYMEWWHRDLRSALRDKLLRDKLNRDAAAGKANGG